MPIPLLISLVEALFQAFGPQLAQLVGAHAAADLTTAAKIGASLQSDYAIIQQASALIQTCETEARDPTDAEMAPFADALAKSQVAMQADQAGG